MSPCHRLTLSLRSAIASLPRTQVSFVTRCRVSSALPRVQIPTPPSDRLVASIPIMLPNKWLATLMRRTGITPTPLGTPLLPHPLSNRPHPLTGSGQGSRRPWQGTRAAPRRSAQRRTCRRDRSPRRRWRPLRRWTARLGGGGLLGLDE